MDRGLIPGKVQGLFSKTAAKRYVLFLARSRLAPGRCLGRRPAGRESRRGGAIAAAAELAGALRFRASEHQKRNQEHEGVEEHVASSPRGLSRTEDKHRDRVAVKVFGEIQNA